MADPDVAWSFDDFEDTSAATTDAVEDTEETAPADQPAKQVEAPKPPAEWRKTYKKYIEEKDARKIFRHWARPTRLQYKILYDYQHNYYDDYIAYMDKRQRGVYDPVPPPQTWEERVLRNCTKDGRRLSAFDYPPNRSKLNDYAVIPSICRADHDKHYYYRQYYDYLIGTPWVTVSTLGRNPNLLEVPRPTIKDRLHAQNI
ncbi:flightin [Daktulosphaira vitifoliae]|uniref:flightin n=1 Tax=Daktulosphaira vitifoliae TaxID=58002 RepID=UPI0021AA8875|nr:flightin [Daktulosphaira vitifoliae]XP_050541081.1 flightin [Daktulosphaira vitifoliae]